MSGPGQKSVAVNQSSEAENSSANIRKASESLRKLLVEREVTPSYEDIGQKKAVEDAFKINAQAIESAKKEQANQKLAASSTLQMAEYLVEKLAASIKSTALTGEQTSSNSQRDDKQHYLWASSLMKISYVIKDADELGADYQPHLDKWFEKVPEYAKYLDLEKGVTEDGKKLLAEKQISLTTHPMFGRIEKILNGSSQKNKKQGLSTEQSGQRSSPYSSNPPRSEPVSRGSEGSSHVQQQNHVGGPIRGRKGRR